ncbi:hypothetical protein Q8F55_003375 [Vanrija albida]|uniref:Uncharacterized protein n=1 Tax=Vanrija albida TaxID=181172 RepID=A0ABR3Q449_9TREE
MESPTSPSFTPPAKPPAAAHSEIEAAATISRSSADPASADTAAGGVGSEPDERLPPSGSPLLDAREPVASDAVNVASADLHSTDQAVAEIPAPAKLTKKQKRVEARKRAEERRTAEEASPTETLVATATPLIADAPADGEGAPTRSPGTAAPATAEADTNHDDDLHPSTPLPLDIPDDADSEAEADGGTVEGEIAGTTKMSKTKKRVASRKRAAERWKNGAEERRKHAWDIAPLVAVHAAQAEADGTLCLQFFTEETLLDSAGKEIILRPIYERYLTQLGNLNSIERSPKHIPMTFDGFATEFISKSYTFPGCSVWKAGLTMRQASLCTAHFEMLLAVLEPVGGPAQMTQQIMSRNQEVFLARMNYWNNRQNPHTDSPDPCTEFLSAKFAEEYMNLIKKYRRWDVNAPAPTEATTAT